MCCTSHRPTRPLLRPHELHKSLLGECFVPGFSGLCKVAVLYNWPSSPLSVLPVNHPYWSRWQHVFKPAGLSPAIIIAQTISRNLLNISPKWAARRPVGGTGPVPRRTRRAPATTHTWSQSTNTQTHSFSNNRVGAVQNVSRASQN